MNTENKDEQSNPVNLPEQFLKLESLLHRHFEKMRHGNEPFGNPHKGQGRVLSLLKLQPVTTQKELSFLLDMRPQSLGELLSKLEIKGYITRKRSEADRRILTIKLTELGTEVADKLDTNQTQQTVFDSLSKNEQTQLGTIMDKLIKELEKEIPQQNDRLNRGRRLFGGGRPDFNSHEGDPRGAQFFGGRPEFGGRRFDSKAPEGFDPRGGFPFDPTNFPEKEEFDSNDSTN